VAGEAHLDQARSFQPVRHFQAADDSILPGGGWTGPPEAALDCACGLYLNDPSAYFESPKD
jgi:hypothetical protein